MRRAAFNARYLTVRLAHGSVCALMGLAFDLLLGRQDEWLYEGSTTPDDR